VAAFGPDVVLHQLTDLPDDRARIPTSPASRPMYREGEDDRQHLSLSAYTSRRKFR
jgi:hypothetical protein